VLGRPLPAQGGDQVEQYLLDYATQLMPHRTTWPVRVVFENGSAHRSHSHLPCRTHQWGQPLAR